MNPKLEAVLRLIQKGEKDDAKLFQGLNLLLEVAESNPETLDPVALALIHAVVRPVIEKAGTALGLKDSF